MRVAPQETDGATKMKSHTTLALRAMPGVRRDVRNALLGLCVDVGQKVLARIMGADRLPPSQRRLVPTGLALERLGRAVLDDTVIGPIACRPLRGHHRLSASRLGPEPVQELRDSHALPEQDRVEAGFESSCFKAQISPGFTVPDDNRHRCELEFALRGYSLPASRARVTNQSG